MRRPGRLAAWLAPPVALLLLPLATNVASADLPGTVRPYQWAAWPLAIVFALLAGWAGRVRRQPSLSVRVPRFGG
jgi:hypothetical protein